MKIVLWIKHKIIVLFEVIVNIFSKTKKCVLEGIFKILPVKKNRIIFSSFCGDNYSCNPRAVYEYLFEHYGNKFEYIWIFNFKNNPQIPDELRKNAKCVQFNSYKSSYYKATSGIWCFNHRNTMYYHKKPQQFYIQTWHGDIGFKAFDKLLYTPEQCKTDPYALKCINDSKMTDVLLSGSEWNYNIMRKAFFYENGEILCCGYPRDDVLKNHSKDYLYNEIRKKYQLEPDCKICMYAPTFRKGFNIGEILFSEEKNVAEEILSSLTKRFPGKWVLFIKYHPACIDKIGIKDFIDNKEVFDVSKYGDVSDLLVGVDALISDYSSISFDFGLTDKPCWLYFEDFKDYSTSDRAIVIDIDQIAFPKCYNKSELLSSIESFDENQYNLNIQNMYKGFGSHENGNACEQVAQRIIKAMQQK